MTVVPSNAARLSVPEEQTRSKRDVWLVFARRAYEEPLNQVGTVAADDVDLAEIFARAIYDEHPWVEMIIVPRSGVRTVIAP